MRTEPRRRQLRLAEQRPTLTRSMEDAMTRALMGFVGVCALSLGALLPAAPASACPGSDKKPGLTCPGDDGSKKTPAPPSLSCPGGDEKAPKNPSAG